MYPSWYAARYREARKPANPVAIMIQRWGQLEGL